MRGLFLAIHLNPKPCNNYYLAIFKKWGYDPFWVG